MKTIKTCLLAIVLSFMVTSCSKDDSIPTDEADYSINLNLAHETNWELADEILVLINEHRASIDLPSIERDQQYASAYAVRHTNYMIDMNRINHDNFGERSEALKQKGAIRVGENVANGYATAEAVVFAWLNSPTHKHVIEGNYTHSGFGVVPNANGTYFFTQLFYSK
tara:strand:+ start:68437 stop:68940 length:504 start_codon:yes stop_codon:yes gene_type:complete